ncbi:AF4/FMR2 family member 4-like isoform X2 [Stylophora pistillata]|uniref:AF4/FMR2 family member 4-like isoform X2 n=1 Tax=Stylophora pistillata TaxID=50429 RepID=UPI000C052923|nr:AF4/FMR2 family member 4-like isoform X2 [Stylophora pistillata]
MSRLETDLRSTGFHSRGMSSGLAIHERERKEAQQERAKLRRQPSNTGNLPLFAEPRKVQPSAQDALQQKIQATLGTYDTIAPVLQHHNHLIGIPRLPPTPVEGQKFVFDRHKAKDAKSSPKNHKLNGVINSAGHLATKSPLTKSNNTIPPSRNSTLNLSKSPTLSNEAITSKSADARKVLSNIKSPTVKEAAVSKQTNSKKTLTHLKSPPGKEATTVKAVESKKTSSQLKSPTLNNGTLTKSAEMKKTDMKPVVNGNVKPRQNVEKEKDKSVTKVKGIKDEKSLPEDLNSDLHKGQNQKSNPASKGKPPKIKLSLPDRNLPVSSVKQENLSMSDHPTNVEKIIEEMQQVAPPLTGIHTPIKGGSSIFAFHRNSIQEPSVLPVLPTKRKPSESTEGKKDSGNDVVLLDDDLVLTDDSDDEHDNPVTHTSPSKTERNAHRRSHSTSSSGSSSDDSDSDSSDSDSDSSASDSNNNTKDKPRKSPVHVASSSPKHTSGRNWGLNHIANALNQSSPSQTTKTKPSPSAANTVGGDGVRGNQVAPAANSNMSCLNSHVARSPVAAASEDSFLSFAEGLFDLSSDLKNGVDIESLTAKLDLPLPAEMSEGSAEPVSALPVEDSATTLKTQQPKNDKKVKRRSSNVESKLNTSQEKGPTKYSPKKPANSKKTDSVKNSTNLKVSNGCTDDSAKKVTKTTKTPNGIVTKKSFKKISETKGVSKTSVSNEAVRETSEVVDDEDIFVDIVSIEPSPGSDNKKVEVKQTAKSKETENPKGVKKKPVTTNGLSKHVNGDGLLSSLISTNGTKDILGKNVEITYDEVNKPESLIVKIDLSLLKRIPQLASNIPPKHSVLSPTVETNGSRDAINSPEVKIPKRKLLDVKPVEQEVSKKVKSNSEDANRTKPHEQSLSSSGNNTRPPKDGTRKRSPSQEKDSHRIKRQKQDNENSKDHDSSPGFQNGSVNENGMDLVDNGVISHTCLCNKTSNVEKKREVDISRFYDPEPKVPYGPDHYLAEAKRLKHKADSSTDKEAKAFLYVDAVLNFARCGKAIEQNECNESESRSAFQMYSETLDLLRYTMRNFVNRYTHRSDRVPDKRLSVLCMRIQSLLYMRLYKLRKDGVMRNVKMVAEHFKGPPKSTQAPSPYTSNTKTTGTPSPLSPTPSPSGSIGSVGSSGSNETMTTPSRNSKPSTGSNAITSPVNVCIPQKIHSMTQQHILQVNNLVYSQDLWDQAQPLVLEFRDFFMDLDRNCGPLTLHSSIVHLCEYIQDGLRRLQELLQSEKASNCKAAVE